jgi:hypothetical protein
MNDRGGGLFVDLLFKDEKIFVRVFPNNEFTEHVYKTLQTSNLSHAVINLIFLHIRFPSEFKARLAYMIKSSSTRKRKIATYESLELKKQVDLLRWVFHTKL